MSSFKVFCTLCILVVSFTSLQSQATSPYFSEKRVNISIMTFPKPNEPSKIFYSVSTPHIHEDLEPYKGLMSAQDFTCTMAFVDALKGYDKKYDGVADDPHYDFSANIHYYFDKNRKPHQVALSELYIGTWYEDPARYHHFPITADCTLPKAAADLESFIREGVETTRSDIENSEEYHRKKELEDAIGEKLP